MDAAEEIPPLFSMKKPHVDGETLRHSPTQAAAVTKVLDDDNLLREIIVRVGFPTTLVRAALVCKRWLEHASDRKFLSRFRKLHPPRLLGYYVTEESFSLNDLDVTHFVPVLPQPPELTAVIRMLESYNFGACTIPRCHNGSVFTRHWHYEETEWTHKVHRPLCPERCTQIFPPLPEVQDDNQFQFGQIFSKEEGNTMSYLYVLGEHNQETEKSTTHVYMLQDGEWVMRTSATCPHGMRLYIEALHIGLDKIYLVSTISDDIIVLDLMASSYSTIQPPQGVKYCYLQSMLSRADDDSGVYLVHVKGFQLCIWLHKEDNWLLVDTICLREMFSTLGMSGLTLDNEGIVNVLIRQLGDNGQFVILQLGDCIFCLDIKCRTLCKVYEKTVNETDIGFVHPFMMIWPPTFPALEDDPARKLLNGQ